MNGTMTGTLGDGCLACWEWHVRKGSERFGIFFQHSFGELKLDEIGRPGRGGGQKLNEVERCEKKWGGQSQRQAQVFLKENNCEMEMEKLGPREIRQTVTWWTILQTGQH